MGWQTFSVVQLFAGDTVINQAGTFVYNGTPGAGKLIASMAPANGTDPYGNTYVQGTASYNGNIITQMNNGGLSIQFAAGQIAGGFQGVISSGGAAGQVVVTSGGTTALDNQAEIALDSGNVAGTPTVSVTQNLAVAGSLTVGGSSNTGDPQTDATIVTTSGNFNGGTLTSHNHSYGHTHPF